MRSRLDSDPQYEDGGDGVEGGVAKVDVAQEDEERQQSIERSVDEGARQALRRLRAGRQVRVDEREWMEGKGDACRCNRYIKVPQRSSEASARVQTGDSRRTHG